MAVLSMDRLVVPFAAGMAWGRWNQIGALVPQRADRLGELPRAQPSETEPSRAVRCRHSRAEFREWRCVPLAVA